MRFAFLVLLGCASSRRDPPPITNTKPPVGEVGTAAPIYLLDMSHDGRWIAICQARTETDGKPGLIVDSEDGEGPNDDHMIGDAYRPYLVWGSGAGEPFDLYLATSHDRRWLAMAKHGAVHVINTHTRTSFELTGARVVDDDTNDGPIREIAIGSAQVAFVRGKDLVIRELQSTRERVIPIRGRIWKVEVDEGGRWAKIGVVERDTDGDGTLEGPYDSTTSYVRSWKCLPDAKQNRRRDDGDRLITTWVDMATGTTVHDRDAIAPVGDRMLYRTEEDTLVLGGRTLAKDCRWGVGAISHDPPRVIAGCGFGPDENATDAPLKILGGRTAHTTQLEFEARYSSTHSTRPSERDPEVVVNGYVCSRNRCVDIASGREREIPGRVEAQFEHYAAYMFNPHGKDDWRDSTWFVIDLVTGEKRELPDSLQRSVQVLEYAMPILEVSEFIGADAVITLYDMRTARPVRLEDGWTIVGHDLAHRRYLIGRADARINFVTGPFRWLEM